MKKVEDPVQAMTGLFKGKIKRSSVELVRQLREEWERDLEKELV